MEMNSERPKYTIYSGVLPLSSAGLPKGTTEMPSTTLKIAGCDGGMTLIVRGPMIIRTVLDGFETFESKHYF